MSDILSDFLGRAEEAFARRAEEEALEHLLAAWRLSRDAGLAALVERLSARLSTGLAPLDCEPRTSALRWHQPMDLPRILASVREGADRGHPGSLRQALQALLEWPEDPRFTPVLLAISRMPIASDMGVPDVLCALLAQMGDPRAVEPLREIWAGLPPDSGFAARLGGVIQRILPKVRPPLGAGAASLCEELDGALSEREAAEVRSAPLREELLTRVYAEPDDVSARLVLADHLLEQGDPLGELIMLQCSLHPDEARIEQLLQMHRLRWEAPLGPHVVRQFTRFAHGFPVAVEMDRWWRERLPEPGPCWSTVQEIGWGLSMFPDVADWLAHPNLRSVQVLQSMDAEMARGLGERGLGVRQLGLRGPLAEKAPDLLTRLEGLPHLTRLAVSFADPEDVRQCARSGLASRLERFDAEEVGRWRLAVTPAKPFPVRVSLIHEPGVPALARVIRHAARIDARALRIRLECRLTTQDRRLLEAAAADYARAEWS